MRLSGEFIFLFFLMKRLIHSDETLKSTHTLKTQGYLYTFYASSCFFLKIDAQSKNKLP